MRIPGYYMLQHCCNSLYNVQMLGYLRIFHGMKTALDFGNMIIHSVV